MNQKTIQTIGSTVNLGLAVIAANGTISKSAVHDNSEIANQKIVASNSQSLKSIEQAFVKLPAICKAARGASFDPAPTDHERVSQQVLAIHNALVV